MRCFFCQNIEEPEVVLGDSESRHLFKVLRAGEGSGVMLMNGKGTVAEGVVQKNRRIRIVKQNHYNKPDKRVHLFVAVPRKHKFDIILSQCTEAGVWAIHPILTERNVAVPVKGNLVDKWWEKLIESCKQSHNPFVPNIKLPVSLQDALDIVKTENMKSYFGTTSTEKENHGILDCSGDIGWFVGPEGGFTENEICLMEENGLTGISVGNWIMRIETAALAGVVILQR